jgi:hypothetical protein
MGFAPAWSASREDFVTLWLAIARSGSEGGWPRGCAFALLRLLSVATHARKRAAQRRRGGLANGYAARLV